MSTRDILRDEFDTLYSIVSSSESIGPASAHTKSFNDIVSARRFLQRLSVNEGYWQSLSYRLGNDTFHNETSEPIEHIGQLLLAGKVKVLKVTVLDPVAHPVEERTIKSGKGEILHFLPASALIDSKKNNIKSFANENEAKSFIRELAPTEQKLTSISKQLNISGKSNKSIPSLETLENDLAKALNNNDAVVLVDNKNVSATPAAKPPEEAAANIPGARSAGLGPAQENEIQEVCGTCTAKSFSVTCQHGRSQGPSNVLQVVAAPNKSSGSAYSLMGVEVSIKKEFSGRDKVTAALALNGNKYESCYNISDGSGTFTRAKKSFSLQGPMQEDTNAWPINAAPIVSTLTGKGCAGKRKKLTIESYPSQYYTLEAKLDIFSKWVEKVNKGWEKWGSKFFSLTPFGLNPKLTGPAGSIAASWGWKENSDWRAYYDVNIAFGLNPIFGIDIEFTLSLVQAAGLAVGIPPSISKMASEHLADLILSIAPGCSASLVGSPHAKFFTDDSVEVSGEAKFSVEGKLVAGVTGRVGSDYVVSGTLYLSGETKITGESVLELNRDGLFGELSVKLDPLIATAKAEVRYFYFFKHTAKDKKWKPWDQIDIYKSEKLKILPR